MMALTAQHTWPACTAQMSQSQGRRTAVEGARDVSGLPIDQIEHHARPGRVVGPAVPVDYRLDPLADLAARRRQARLLINGGGALRPVEATALDYCSRFSSCSSKAQILSGSGSLLTSSYRALSAAVQAFWRSSAQSSPRNSEAIRRSDASFALMTSEPTPRSD
jgi:hypothetical protein